MDADDGAVDVGFLRDGVRGREIDLAIAACAIVHGAALWTDDRQPAGFLGRSRSPAVLNLIAGNQAAGSHWRTANVARNVGRLLALQQRYAEALPWLEDTFAAADLATDPTRRPVC